MEAASLHSGQEVLQGELEAAEVLMIKPTEWNGWAVQEALSVCNDKSSMRLPRYSSSD